MALPIINVKGSLALTGMSITNYLKNSDGIELLFKVAVLKKEIDELSIPRQMYCNYVIKKETGYDITSN